MATAAQIKAIHTLGRKLNMDGDSLYAMVESLTGRDSIRALTCAQGGRVIDELKRRAGQPVRSAGGQDNADQLNKIFALAKELGWDDPKRLNRFCEARFKVSHPRFLSASQARKVIEALKSMLDGGRGERRRAGK